jgi:hypothetical protein
MTFFYDLNKRLADLAKKQDLKESAIAEKIATDTGKKLLSKGERSELAKQARAGKDIGKPGKMFKKVAADAAKRYGSKEAGERVAAAAMFKQAAKKEESIGSTSGFLEGSTGDYSAKKARAGKDIGKPGKTFAKIEKSAAKYGARDPGAVAGAVLKKLRAKEAIDPSLEEADMEESALQAYLGKKKYGEQGMKALQKAGREGASKETMARIRAKHDKMDEADMEEGNKFTGNLMKARAAGLKKADLDGDGDMETVREASKPDYIDLDKDGNRKETMKKAAKDAKKSKSSGTAFDPEVAKGMFAHKDDSRYDVKDTGYSKRYTRKSEEPTDDDDTDAPVSKGGEPKKKGRPKGTKRAIGAKGPTGKSKLMSKGSIKEADMEEDYDKDEYDEEGEMARSQFRVIADAAKELHAMVGDNENLPEWVQKKITLAQAYIDSARDYLKANRPQDEVVAEKAVSKAQRAAAGIAYAAKKGELPKKELRGASKEMAKMATGELKKFAKTKEKGLPEKVKEADAEATPAKKGGFEFGKGIYESLDKKYRQALTEGMNISVNMSQGQDGQPTKNITVSADGDDAESLAQLLKMAGLGGGSEACPTCGKSDCGCEELDENSPDWPTNTETSDDALQYSGGLNGPKSTGQTTVPVIASQLRRQVSMEESVELERSLFRLYQNYKAQ